MASKKDMRRADLIVPYAEPAKTKDENDMSSTLSTTLPMAAAWLAETGEQRQTSSTPAYFQVGMSIPQTPPTRAPTDSRMSIENLKTFDPFAEADEDTGQVKQTQQDYIHIRIQQRNGRKTLTTVQGLPKKFDQKKILKVIKKKFACNGTIVTDAEMGEVVQLQGDQRKDVQDFLTDKKEGLGLDTKTIKVHGF
ncbi:translation initiation factor SUI1 [Pyrenophora seminiperda CCB06]|uniref:Translation initiation factor SUI1 n=1 Tax=Pyrenophora seminiperda CCB06 TaxID=1302712 RepID=A0A3M7MEG0_9PLEO|nr:translation initiation factor SUI1 [Pyrenophora seminiperda CCB06]